MSDMGAYELVVGLEVHIQLLTQSKLFAADPNAFGEYPNKNVSVITLAHPGTMPKLNKQAVELAIRMGLACNSEISRYCIFDRKNYFYPDLPKGFQTTQDRTPICIGGEVEVKLKEEGGVTVPLNRIHLEEDAGKSIHEEGASDSLIDLNRAGVPLIELVTEPEIHSAEAAMAFLTEIRQMVRYLDVCDGNMEQGSLRCDANISIRKPGNGLGKKVEVKNMNSIRNVGKAIKHEYKRQVELLDKGEEITTETRLFDANTGRTYSMREKEELNDNRYFTEHDLSPFRVTDEWIASIRSTMPATPKQTRKLLVEEYGLTSYEVEVITGDKKLVDFFLETCKLTNYYKAVSNWLMGPIKGKMNESEEDAEIPITSQQLADLVEALTSKEIHQAIATKQVFPSLCEDSSESVKSILNKLNDESVHQHDISDVILKVVEANPEKVKAYRHGKKNLMGMFMGEVMKETNGAVDPKEANELLRKVLDNQN